MTTKSIALSPLMDAIRAPFRRFTEDFEPLRPELYRYCRYLTRSAWDAEDLVQDTLLRAFVVLGTAHEPPENPKAWLFRVASNRWLNHLRDVRETPMATLAGLEAGSSAPHPQGTREAAGALVAGLAPQERAAVVLKDVFDFSLQETAHTLGTTVGAVKAALHRGRGRLQSTDPPTEAPMPAVVTEFCDAFNARDLERVLSLLLEVPHIELSGTFAAEGREVAKRSFGGLLFATEMAMKAGIAAPYRGNIIAEPPRFEAHVHRGEPIVLTLWNHEDGWAVRALSRIAVSDDRIAAIKTFMHAPEAIAEVAGELGLPSRTNGYYNWDAPTRL